MGYDLVDDHHGECGDRKHHPEATFKDVTITSDAAFPALVTGVTDLAPDGGEPAITEWLSFFETYGYHAADIVAAGPDRGPPETSAPARSPGLSQRRFRRGAPRRHRQHSATTTMRYRVM